MTNDNKPGYKKTKLGWIPEEWEVKLLKGLAEIDSESLNSKTEKDYTFRYVSLSNVNNGFIDKELEVLDYENAPSRARRIVKKDDVLMATVRPNLKAFGYVEEDENDLIASTGFAVIRTKSFLDSKYLFHFLFSNKMEAQLYSLVVGSNYPAINSSDVKHLKIPLPPLPEQKKIAQILSTWDKAIEQTQALLTQLQLRKKGLMQQLLTGKTRLKGFEWEWEEVTLGDITTRVTQKNTELNDNVVTISAQRGFVRQEDFFKKRVASATLSGYFLINKGDFCYNKSYSKGYPMGAFKRLDDLDKAVVTTLYICFSLKPNIDSDYILNFFEGGLMVNNLMRIAQEGGRAHGLLNIGLGDFFSLKLSIPNLKEQQAIAKVLNAADRGIQNQQSILASLQTQKKGLMQQLLTGQKRVELN